MPASSPPETVMGAAPERYRWVAEVAAAAVAQSEPTHFVPGLDRLVSTMEYLGWQAGKTTTPFDLATVLDLDEFMRYSECRWDENSLGFAALVLVAARAHRDTEPDCGCVLHRPLPFDTGSLVASALALAEVDGTPEAAGVLARLPLRHPWDWAGEAARAALDLADATDGFEHAAATIGALAHYAGSRQGQRLRAVDAFSPEALDGFARVYRWSRGFTVELDQLVGVLVALDAAERRDCTCVLCTPVLGDFTTMVRDYQPDLTLEPGAWVVRTAAAWALAAGSDPRLVLIAAHHLTYTATRHPEAVGAGIDLNMLATCGGHRCLPPASDLEFNLTTALVRHRWESHCDCILCAPPRLNV